MFLERWKFKYELKINHAKLCIKIDNIQNIFGNDTKYCCCVELKQDRRASRLTSPGLEIDITLALPLPRLLCHYQLRLRAILYTVLSHQRPSRGELLLGVQRGQTNLGLAEVRGRSGQVTAHLPSLSDRISPWSLCILLYQFFSWRHSSQLSQPPEISQSYFAFL